MNEENLVKEARSGNNIAFSELIEAYYSKLFFYCVSKTGNKDISQDIVQDTFLKAMINLKQLRNPGSFGYWVFSIAKNKIRKYYKNNPLHVPLSPSAEICEQPHPMGKDNGTIPRALVLLKPYLADVIIFKYYCGMKNKDIALLFQIDEKLVKSRLYEARKKLKGFIARADAAGSPLEASELIKERLKIMENMNFVAKGAYVFSRMSLKEQLDLYEQIKKDGHITGEVLTAIGQIKQGKEFIKECRSEIVYPEFIKILLYCNQFVSSQFVGECEDGELIKKDMHKALETAYDIEAVEVWLFVENIEETINWYGKALGWHGGVDAYSNEGEAVFGCIYNGKEEPISEGYRNSYAICLMKGTPAEEQKHFIFIVVSDINKVFDKLKDAGAKILYPVKKEPWGMYTFSALDLNGYHLKIAQRI